MSEAETEAPAPEKEQDDVTVTPIGKVSHITNTPGHEVGDKVLALCGTTFKVKVLWDNVPEDHPICRDCVDVALTVLTEVTDARADTMRSLVRLDDQVRRVIDAALSDGLALDVLDAGKEYRDQRAEKQAEKRRLREAKALVKADKAAKKKDKKDDDRPPVAPEQSGDDN